MAKRELTNKQRRFGEEYIVDWNSTQAAIRAGYSKKTAGSIGHELLKKPEIQTYISEIQKDLAKQAGLSSLLILRKLKAIMTANLGDMLDDNGKIKPISELTEAQKQSLLEVYSEAMTQGDTDIEITKRKIKLHDPLKAITIINQMLGFNAPEVQEIKQETTVKEIPLTPEQIKKFNEELENEY